MDVLELTPDSPAWDPQDEVYSNNEDTFMDDRGELIYPCQYKKCKLIHDDDIREAEVFKIEATGDDWEAAVDAVLAVNDDIFGHGLDDDAFDFEADPIRAHVADLTGILDEDILNKAFGDHLRESRFAMLRTNNQSWMNGLQKRASFSLPPRWTGVPK